jgi:Pirin
MSPSDLGQSLEPFVFLDLFDTEGTSLSGFGLHPLSGIAALTYLLEGNINNPRIDRPWRDAVCKPELPGSLGRPDLVDKDKTPGAVCCQTRTTSIQLPRARIQV